jgi:hypothetical protein
MTNIQPTDLQPGDDGWEPFPADEVRYRGYAVTVLADGRWRFGPLTFETVADAQRYLNSLPRKGPRS